MVDMGRYDPCKSKTEMRCYLNSEADMATDAAKRMSNRLYSVPTPREKDAGTINEASEMVLAQSDEIERKDAEIASLKHMRAEDHGEIDRLTAILIDALDWWNEHRPQTATGTRRKTMRRSSATLALRLTMPR